MARPITWKVFVDTQRHNDRRDLYVVGPGPSGERCAVKLQFITAPPGTMIAEPTAYETQEDQMDGIGVVTGLLQAMLDEAWIQGMRPTGYEPAADQGPELAAVRYHLEDMRALAKIPAR